MTQDEIIRMAQEAGIDESESDWMYWAAMERFAALVIANNQPQSSMAWQEGFEAGRLAERNACAKVCDDWPNGRDDVYSIGVAIRART